jgi:hypothetical protein
MSTPPLNPAPSSEEEKVQKKKERYTRAILGASSEILFVILPFIVIGITLAHRSEFRTILFIPEWSIVSAVIVGQAIVKVASAVLGRTNIVKEGVVLILSILLVCLLVPILIILAIGLTSVTISLSLALTQTLLFLLSISVFWFASWIENMNRTKP